jgi:hypothetical protein
MVNWKESTMSVSAQQIQTVLRTYKKQLKLSGFNRKKTSTSHQCLKDERCPLHVDRMRHLSKQRGNKNRHTQ